jgi:glucan endo-1,3-beta-D-glucosidase
MQVRWRATYMLGPSVSHALSLPLPTSLTYTRHIMQYLSLLALVGAATAQSLSKGFNYGNVFTDGSPKQQADFEAEFNRAKTLPNASGFSSARLYTMIQGGTANTPISAIQAAIDTQTSLLLGLWASASSDVFQNELDALRNAIEQYGTAFTDLIVGISVGSEDLYRISVQGILNESGLGEGPDVLVDYIQRTRSVIAGTAASAASVGHVDTWNDWVNGSNSAVIQAVDWIGFNGEVDEIVHQILQILTNYSLPLLRKHPRQLHRQRRVPLHVRPQQR